MSEAVLAWIALASFAVITAAVAWRVPRAPMWIAMGALSFILSTFWQKAGLPHRDLFGGFTDLVIIYAIYTWGKERWELFILDAFSFMILLDFLHAAGYIKDTYWLVVVLEGANYAALLVMFGAGMAERIRGGVRRRNPAPGVLGGFTRTLHAERKDHPWAWFWR